MKARIDALFPNWKDKCISVQMSIFGEEISNIEKYKDGWIALEIKKWKERRSLTANAYFHVLCKKIAEAIDVSDAWAKNILIGRYGQMEYIGDELSVIKSNLPAEYMMEQEHLHCREVNGPDVECHYYVVYRQTRTYDSKEFSRLLNGTISECKELGIETLPPDEIERMMKKYGNSVKDEQ